MNKQHDDVTRRIWHRPDLVGLSGIVLSAREPNLLRKDGNIYHQPDNLCFDPDTHTLYNIEYKTRKGEVKARMQLEESAVWLQHLFPDYKIKNMYVHDNYIVKEIDRRSK